jgi:hypothetical protein
MGPAQPCVYYTGAGVGVSVTPAPPNLTQLSPVTFEAFSQLICALMVWLSAGSVSLGIPTLQLSSAACETLTLADFALT